MYMTKSMTAYFNSDDIYKYWMKQRKTVPDPHRSPLLYWHPYSCPPYMYWKPLYSHQHLQPVYWLKKYKQWSNLSVFIHESVEAVDAMQVRRIANSTKPTVLTACYNAWATQLPVIHFEHSSHNIISFIKPFCGLAWASQLCRCKTNETTHPCNRGLAVGPVGLEHLRPSSEKVI